MAKYENATWWRVGKLIWRVYGFALLMATSAIIPGCNFLYSGHGGPAWLLLLSVFPIICYRLWRLWRTSTSEGLASGNRTFVVASLAAYVPLTLGAAAWGSASIQRTFGLPVLVLDFWAMFFFPFNLPLMFLPSH